MNDEKSETYELTKDKEYAVITAYYPIPRASNAFRVIWYGSITLSAIALVVAFSIR